MNLSISSYGEPPPSISSQPVERSRQNLGGYAISNPDLRNAVRIVGPSGCPGSVGYNDGLVDPPNTENKWVKS